MKLSPERIELASDQELSDWKQSLEKEFFTSTPEGSKAHVEKVRSLLGTIKTEIDFRRSWENRLSRLIGYVKNGE